MEVITKIRKYIKLLRKKKPNLSLEEAQKLICKQVRMDEAFNDEEMEVVEIEVWTRLSGSWPFKKVI